MESHWIITLYFSCFHLYQNEINENIFWHLTTLYPRRKKQYFKVPTARQIHIEQLLLILLLFITTMRSLDFIWYYYYSLNHLCTRRKWKIFGIIQIELISYTEWVVLKKMYNPAVNIILIFLVPIFKIFKVYLFPLPFS